MALFKEVYCDECGKKAPLLTRTYLDDEKCLCGDCTRVIPTYLFDKVNRHDMEWYHKVKEYVDYSKNELKEKFCETHKFQGIHLDMENKLFYVDEGVLEDPLYLELKYLQDFKLVFNPTEVKDGLDTKVIGSLLLVIDMENPAFFRTKTISKSIKAPAKKKFLSSKVEHGNPKGMDEFLLCFCVAWERARPEGNDGKESYDNYAAPDELQQAMCLFMLDDLEGITLEELKARRNRLIKSFHPDTNSEVDTLFAQKINKAFDLLKNEL